MNDILINYKDVVIYQKDQLILDNLNISLFGGEFVFLIGKVGTGKSSFLKTIYKELDISEGEAEVLGFDLKKMRRSQIHKLRKNLGIVFQDFQLLTDRSVYYNLDFVLRCTGWKDSRKRADRIAEVLQLVGMEHKADKIPAELSGGEQQRVVIARAVLNKPKIILADEPTGNLDYETGRTIVELLFNISKTGSLVIMTTHNLQLLYDYPGKVFRCEDRKLELAKEYEHVLGA